MCIIVYKPDGVKFPNKKTLQNCFDNNPDGAGFMYCYNNKVYINKGFDTFTAFNSALKKARTRTGDGVPYVLHFRISTQAGRRADCCHPFPLSPNMDDLRLLSCVASYGVAHNGIIELTSEYYKKVDYSDTMLFITDYLSLIIDNKGWYKGNAPQLIYNIARSKFAIMDRHGHVELIGDYIDDADGCYYSNTSYQARSPLVTITKPATTATASADAYEYDDGDTLNGEPISAYNCGLEWTGTLDYCFNCSDCDRCHDFITQFDYQYMT